MTNEQFLIEVEEAFSRSKTLLNKKEKEYSSGKDRLDQFWTASALNDEPATRSLWGMVTKHITSLATMVKNPEMYDLDIWREKITDLRNYTLLLDALISDIKDDEDEDDL